MKNITVKNLTMLLFLCLVVIGCYNVIIMERYAGVVLIIIGALAFLILNSGKNPGLMKADVIQGHIDDLEKKMAEHKIWLRDHYAGKHLSIVAGVAYNDKQQELTEMDKLLVSFMDEHKHILANELCDDRPDNEYQRIMNNIRNDNHIKSVS